MADSDSSEVEDNGLFDEPEDFYQPEKQPTFETHKLLDGRELQLRLVGHNPLWVGAFSYFSSRACLKFIWYHFERFLYCFILFPRES